MVSAHSCDDATSGRIQQATAERLRSAMNTVGADTIRHPDRPGSAGGREGKQRWVIPGREAVDASARHLAHPDQFSLEAVEHQHRMQQIELLHRQAESHMGVRRNPFRRKSKRDQGVERIQRHGEHHQISAAASGPQLCCGGHHANGRARASPQLLAEIPPEKITNPALLTLREIGR